MFGCSSAATAGDVPVGRTISFAATRPVPHQTNITITTPAIANMGAEPRGRAVINHAATAAGAIAIAPIRYGPATRSN